MQNEQLNPPSRKSAISLSPLILPLSELESAASEDDTLPLINCCRLLAFSNSESESSDSIARIAAIKPDELLWDPPAVVRLSKEQSGHSQWRVSAKICGREERQVTCHGVIHVVQVRVSSGNGSLWQIMQMPSPSQGSWAEWAIRAEEPAGRRKRWQRSRSSSGMLFGCRF